MVMIGRWVKRLLVVAFLAGLMLAVDRLVPPWHLPWKKLEVDHPVGLATGLKLSILAEQPEACLATLERSGAPFERVGSFAPSPECGWVQAVKVSRIGAPLRPAGPVTASCAVTLAALVWHRQVLEPAAQRHFRQSVAAIDHFGSYSCRRLYGRETGSWSEHASANALDIAGFRLADGQRISVLKDWPGSGAKAAFLRDAHKGACSLFAVTLGPEANAAHADHFHVDMGRWRSCR